jgi:hypothetical protein
MDMNPNPLETEIWRAENFASILLVDIRRTTPADVMPLAMPSSFAKKRIRATIYKK